MGYSVDTHCYYLNSGVLYASILGLFFILVFITSRLTLM